MKARLLAGFNVLLLIFVPLNVVKLLLISPPELGYRIVFNLIFAVAALLSLYWLKRGRLELAGSTLLLVVFVPIHVVVFFVSAFPQPLSGAIQMLIFDLVWVLLALVFASRRTAFIVLIMATASQLFFHYVELGDHPIPGSIPFAAETILRDGLVAMGFVFCLGFALVTLIELAQRRSEETLQASRAVNENLEKLVSERTRDLEVATQLAREASQAKGDFLANMSHEIRTPLNGIIASSELLLCRSDLPPDAIEHARLISESGELLVKQLGNVLDFSKIEAGQIELEKHTFELKRMAADSVALLVAQAKQAGVLIDLSVAAGLPKYLEGDSFRLRQILLNLLSNAVKFTPPGGHVQLVIAPGETSVDALQIRFEVRDAGIGMDEVALQRVFERFGQAHASITRRFGGTGLGLAISSRLVSMMGGQLQANSVPGQGSSFYFTLPLTAAEAPAPLSARIEIASLLNMCVLVADDNAINRKILAAQLARLGCRCRTASHGEEVLACLHQEPLPDVVLMDCEMPGLNGWDTTSRLRNWASDSTASELERKAASIPVIAITGATLPAEQIRCEEAGMNDFLAKPVKLADLQRALQPFVPAESKKIKGEPADVSSAM